MLTQESIYEMTIVLYEMPKCHETESKEARLSNCDIDISKDFLKSAFWSSQNFVPYHLIREQNLSLCTNITVT